MDVRAFIDASYGVHTASGKSHTGCAIVVGYGGPVYTKSTKQKIVTKSSTEAELVGISDTASQAIFCGTSFSHRVTTLARPFCTRTI